MNSIQRWKNRVVSSFDQQLSIVQQTYLLAEEWVCYCFYLQSILVKRDENQCQIDEIQSVNLYWGNLGKLEFCFLDSLPLQFIREINVCEIMENVSGATAIFSSSGSWCRVIVGFLANCIGVEQHHTCDFQPLPNRLPSASLSLQSSACMKRTSLSLRDWKW